MKYILILFFVLFFAVSANAQVNSDLPTPTEKYSANSERLIELSGLLGKINNGKDNFRGKISQIKWEYDDNTVIFDIGKNTFDIDFSNVSNAGRSHLTDLLKKNNQVVIRAYAGGSSGVWMVIDIFQQIKPTKVVSKRRKKK